VSLISSPLQIGPYAIGKPVSDYPQIQKLSWWNRFDIKRAKVSGLKLYKSSKPVDFFGRPNKVILGAVQGSIWSLSIFFVFKTEDLMGDALLKVTDYYKTHFGEPTSDKHHPLRWRTSSADITINVGSVTFIGGAFHHFTLTLSAT
jgi:hypothetical protein